MSGAGRTAWGGIASVFLVCLPTLPACGAGSPKAASMSTAPGGSASIPMSALVTFEQMGVDLEGLLSADGDRASQAGAGPVHVVASGAAAEGDRLGGFVTLGSDTCLLALARGTARVDDLDILAFDDAGTNLVADQSVGPKPSVMVCPPSPPRVYFAARVAAGSGLVVIGVQEVPRERSAAVASSLGARMAGLADEAATREAWSGLDGRIDAHRRALGGKWEEIRRASVPLSRRAPSFLSMPLPASRCLDLYVMPNEEVRSVDVTLMDESGREIDRAAALGDERYSLVCTPVDVTLSIALRPHQGFGLAAVVLSRSAPGAETELSVRPEAVRVAAMGPLGPVRSRFGESLAGLGYDKPKTVAEGTLDAGRTSSYPLAVQPGCFRIDALVGAPTVGVRTALWDANDDMVASSHGGERATLFACGGSAKQLTLDIEGVGRPGGFAVEVRREKAAPPELLEHPLAAGRLLARANGGGSPFDLRTLTGLRKLEVSDTKRATFDVSIPAGVCEDILVALGPGASGLTVRASELSNGKELGAGTGAQAVAVRACSEGGARSVRVQAMVASGATSALAAEVPVSPRPAR